MFQGRIRFQNFSVRLLYGLWISPAVFSRILDDHCPGEWRVLRLWAAGRGGLLTGQAGCGGDRGHEPVPLDADFYQAAQQEQAGSEVVLDMRAGAFAAMASGGVLLFRIRGGYERRVNLSSG